MPQMAPINWLIIIITTVMMMMMMSSLLYFNLFYKPSFFSIKKKNKINWKW